jgi:2-methylcitrate dehydratase PrpD
VLDLVRKTRFILDDELGKRPNSQNPAKVMIKLKNGAIYEETVYAAKGTILNPMTKEEVYQKFRGFASAVLPNHNREAIIETVAELERVENIRELIRLVVAG